MTGRCAECGNELPEGRRVCPVCADDEVSTWRDPPSAPPGAAELSQWNSLGWKPGSVMDAVEQLPDEQELPAEEESATSGAMADLPRTVMRTVALGLLAVVVTAAILARWLGGDADESAPRERPDWPALHAPDRLAALREIVPDEIPVPRPDARRAAAEQAMAALEAEQPEAVRTARAAHVPLAVDSDEAHTVSQALFDRLAAADAAWAVALGVHPHPTRLPPVTARDLAEEGFLLEDVLAWCASHPPSGAPDLHEKDDRIVLQASAEAWLEGLDRDDSALRSVSSLVMDLWQLVVIDCCPKEERRAALTSCLLDVPGYLDAVLARLHTPESDDCRRASTALWFEAQRMRHGTRGLGGGAELREAERVACDALVSAAARLAGAAAPEGGADSPGGAADPSEDARTREEYFEYLTAQAGGRSTPRALFDAALDDLREANARQLETLEQGYTAPRGASRIRTPAERIRRLRTGTARWVGELAEDPGVAFHAVVDESVDWEGLLYSPGVRGPFVASAFVGTWPDGTLQAEDAERQKRERQHLAAHETYPGHHLQHVLSRETCELRSLMPSDFVVEGWAAYAEDLVHETGMCGDDVMDRFVRARDRASTALGAALEILHACGQHDASQLSVAAGLGSDETVVDWVRARVERGSSTPYLFGRREIERLRRETEEREGAAFDLGAFHRRLLSLGPIPSRLLEAELRQK